MNKYTERIADLRKKMEEAGCAVYFIPMDDCHASEYVSEHFKCVKFMSGFSGSAAQIVVTKNGAWLFTDGRYWVQAEKELSGSGIELIKQGAPGVPEVPRFIAEKLLEEAKESAKGSAAAPELCKMLGFDGNVVNVTLANRFFDAVKDACGDRENYGDSFVPAFVCERDLVGEIWTDRPGQPCTPIWQADEKFTGESAKSKLSRIRKELLKEAGTENYLYLVNSLDDIAWTFNVRANDIPCNPAVYAFAAITKDEARLFVQEGAADGAVKAALNGQGAELFAYGVRALSGEDAMGLASKKEAPVVLASLSSMNLSTYKAYKERGFKVIDIKNPSTAMKAVKNETEIACTKKALLRDSAQVINFMYRLKKLAKKAAEESGAAGGAPVIKNEDGSDFTELTADELITSLRAAQPEFIERSFSTIAGYGANAAMMHYEATKESYAVLKAKGMLLVDSGAQYEDGTTDITRTFVLGELTDEEKKAFTLTAVAVLRLQNAHFIEGASGDALDILARLPMWEQGWDYKCGTGHGVGHILNVHEGPQRVCYKLSKGTGQVPLKAGMVVTDEPGVYREGKFGIRTENELLVVPFTESDDGSFLKFEPLTYIPIDKDGIDTKYMTAEDIEALNEYHAKIYEKVSPLLSDEVKEWLKEATSPVCTDK